MRNTVIGLKQSKGMDSHKVYRVVDLNTGEKGGWVSENVVVDKNSWVGKSNTIIMPPKCKLSLQNTIIDGTNIEVEVNNGLVLLKDCVVRPFARIIVTTYDKAVISNCIFGSRCLFEITELLDLGFYSVSVNNLNLGNSARFKIDSSIEEIETDLIPVATFNDISILSSGEFYLTNCKGDISVNKVLIGEDCKFHLDEYKGILIDEFECIGWSKFAFENVYEPKYSKFGSEIMIVDTDISKQSFINLVTAGEVILSNQVMEHIILNEDDDIVNGVFKSKNQFVEEWNIE